MRRTRYFIEPFDVLFLRGNKLFGAPGSFGESLIPPWPSVAAGALRSALLATRGHDAAAYARGEITDDPEMGTPDRPGTFTVTGFDLARRAGNGRIESLHPLPSDLSVHGADGGGATRARRIKPRALADGIESSAAKQRLAVLAEPERGKPASASWLSAEGWSIHLAGGEINPQRHLVGSAKLWCLDTRIGIALDPNRRRAADGALFTAQAVALRKREHMPPPGARNGASGYDVGFLVEIAGIDAEALPATPTLRFGGDGRAALATRDSSSSAPECDYDAIAAAGRCRLILTTPGLFTGGWLPTGATRDGRDILFDLHGVSGRLACAAVPRAEVISGFDVARRQPKPAQRVAPAGSVYWLDEIEATPAAFRKLVEQGLWSEPVENAHRRAEGFNRCTLGAWRDHE